jgi:hypothetical protein
MLRASHQLFGDTSAKQRERTQLFLEKLLAVAGWGGDVDGFLQNWRVRHLAPHQNSWLLAEVIELQHEGKAEDYIVRYITDRYEPDED